MKKSLLIISMIFLSLNLHAQDKSEILPMIEKIIEYSVNKDFAVVLDYTYPKVFEFASKEQMIELMTSMLDNEDFSIAFLPTNYDIQVSDVKNIDGGKYAMVEYNTLGRLKFKDEESLNTEESLNVLKVAFSNANVSYNEKTKTFDIMSRTQDLAISDESTAGTWRFLNANKEDGQMLRLLLNEQILNAFNL
ncbi:hypothetical protein NMK71_04460 [Weeksellaceae bacterium KMM 9713]|uniref:Uncharacterized protein n=1 Tax=Profundicola chukchiensis TaxID=2961959 RepID=A0A9X4RU13_9FLAO|nr:hypothetical protein [Profundicola chukchiensis]MDG4945658.1 hypothetical protein [Profundicola chukchiensis]